MLRNNLAAFNSEGSASVKEFPGLKILAAILAPFFFGACAVDRPPTGGPRNNAPLSVTYSNPAPDAINASPQTIRIGFSHYVGKDDLSKSIFFAPLVDDYEVSIHGKEAFIRVYSPLKQNRTYTLTLREYLKSLYGNHRLDRSWALAFATGPVIDHGSIVGRVWSSRLAPARGVTVMAYAVSPSENTKFPARPDYICQTDPSGSFHFDNLASGSYRIVAITDRDGNLQFDRGKESFAVTSGATVRPGLSRLELRLAPDDPATLSLRSCRTINNSEIEITFSNPFPVRNLDLSALRIENSETGATLPIFGCFSPSRNSEDTVFRLLTAPMTEKASYRLRFMPDRPGSRPSELTFYGNPRKEHYPELSVTIVPANGSDNVVPETVRPESGSSIELHSNLPVAESSVRPAVTLTLSGNGRETPVPFTILQIDSRTFAVVAKEGFLHGRDYRVQVRPGLLRGLAGSPSETALVESRFSTAGEEEYGEISGTGTAGTAAVIVEARRIGTEGFRRMVVRPAADGRFSFSFHDLPSGEYTITGFLPSSSRVVSPITEWNSGSLTPFVPSDPFTALTVTIRPGWSTENVRLDLPSTRQPAVK
jgi:hypothetical protein